MTEILTQTPNQKREITSSDSNSSYVEKLNGKRTARHASEEDMNSPLYRDVAVATAAIRKDIQPAFEALNDYEHEPDALVDLKEKYWLRAQHVGTEHGAKPGFKLDDYLQVGPSRSYDEIKEVLDEEYLAESVPGSVLDSIDAYHQVLGVNPAHAATITTELIGRGLPHIAKMSDEIVTSDGLSPQEATTVAVAKFIRDEVPYHINYIIDRYGYGDDAVKPYMAKNSFYPEAESEKKDAKLELSVHDVQGLIRAYDIQSRPYNTDELDMANELASDFAMQAAMIRIQESLVSFSEDYLKQHPERAQGDLRNFSEIFVPKREEDGLKLLPNPKLLRAMVNNVLPGIAQNLIERGLGAKQIDEEAIRQGVDVASKEYKLFTTNIGQFANHDPQKQTAELHSMYRVVCPANNLFPNFLTAHLANYYAEAKTNLKQ